MNEPSAFSTTPVIWALVGPSPARAAHSVSDVQFVSSSIGQSPSGMVSVISSSLRSTYSLALIDRV